jgi:hypothetical protein
MPEIPANKEDHLAGQIPVKLAVSGGLEIN